VQVDFDRLRAEQHGVVTRSQAVAALGPSRVRHLVESSRWRRVSRGVLLTVPGVLTREQRWWVGVLAAGADAVLAGIAAAEAGGLSGRWPDAVDVLVPYGRAASDFSGRVPWLRVRRTRHLPEKDVVRDRPDRTGMARSVVDAAQWAATDADAVAVVAAACRQELIRADDVRAAVEAMPRAFRRQVVLRALEEIEGLSAVLAEIDFVRLCRRHQLPPPDRQERGARSLDVFWTRWEVHVVINGIHDEAPPSALHFPAYAVRVRPDEVLRGLRGALLAAGWQPGR
jgi:hypothetical protein